MDNIIEYIWGLSVIILIFASLLKSVGKRKQQPKKVMRGTDIHNEADMPFDRAFENLRKSIAEAAKRSKQSQQMTVQQSKPSPKPNTHSKQPIYTVVNDNAQFAAIRQFSTSSTTQTVKAMKATAKKQAERHESTKSTAAELVKNTELSKQFNLRDAIVYSEIMKPKFED